MMDVDVIWVRAYGTSPTSSGHVFGSMKAKNDASFFGSDAMKCPSVRARVQYNIYVRKGVLEMRVYHCFVGF